MSYGQCSFGAIGYLLKDTHIRELVPAVRMAYQGYTQFGPGLYQKTMGSIQRIPTEKSSALASDIPQELPSDLQKLTKREKEVFMLYYYWSNESPDCRGSFLSQSVPLKNHVTSILSRLNLPGRIQAAMFASPFLPLLNLLPTLHREIRRAKKIGETCSMVVSQKLE